jgi:hypothetical protein
MNEESWNTFLGALRTDHKSPFYASKQDFERFAQFVEQIPGPERIPMLLHAYDRYRSLGVCNNERGTDQFETSCYSILISTILSSGIRRDPNEATEILRRSYHRCGHGSDVEPPLTLAERAFRNQPYSNALFDSVLDYRETLRSSRSSQAANVKRKLNWILWHDSRRVEKSCHTRRIQKAIHSMENQNAFHWEWLLRNTAAGLNSAPGKYWLKEGSKRLAPIDREQFLSRIDDWFTFPQEEVKLSAPGSAMLRLLVWYGVLADAERSLPVLVRLAHVSWDKRAPVGKVMAALAWTLRSHGGSKFAAEVRLVCNNWASNRAEARRLEKVYFPEHSRVREQADQDARERRNKDLDGQMEATLNSLHEKYPHVFGPDGPAARFLAAREKAVESNRK